MAGEHDDDDARLKARLSALSEKLSDAGGAAERSQDEARRDHALGGAFSQGMRAMGEFVASVGFGAFLGWKLDQWTGAAPWFLLTLLALGTVAGFWNVYRMAAGATDRRDRK